MTPRSSLPFLLAATLCAAPRAQDPGTSYLFRVDLTKQEGALVKLEGFDVLGACGGGTAQLAHERSVDVVVLPEELAAFRALGLPATLVERGRPFRDVLAARVGPLAPPDANYFTVAEVEAELLKLQTAYPKLARRVDLNALTKTGLTHESRHIYALEISDNVATSEDEPAVLIASQHHARELNTPYMSIQAARRILAGYATDPFLKKVVDSHEIWIVPTVNPDGVNYVWTRDRWWRKNRRKNSIFYYGVDLNRNYPFMYGKCGGWSSFAGSQVYKGPSAASEPETKTMIALARLIRPQKYLDFHSYGQEVLATYNPCTQLAMAGTGFATMEAHFRRVLYTAMRYRTRTPAAAGEAPESHWALDGSLSYLVEVGTSFQPLFATTVAEEKRVWLGVRAWLALSPSLTGHVRSLKAKAPLGATLAAASLGFKNGELARSRASNGRFHLWLSPGTTNVTVSAPGHTTRVVKLNAPALGASTALDIVLVPTLPAATILGPATARLGTAATITLRASDPGKRYVIPIALGTAPGFDIPPRHVTLNPDALFFATLVPQPPVYFGNAGILDARGEARATLKFPAIPVLAGLKLWFAGATLETGWPFEIKAFTAPLGVTLTN